MMARRRYLGAVSDDFKCTVLDRENRVIPERLANRPKIRDEIFDDAAALGGRRFSAHFG
jgi:hypothetical protein